MKFNTSSLIAELLLGGGLVEIVLVLLLDIVTGGRLLPLISGLHGTNAVLLASAGVVMAYYLGSLLNAVSRLFFRPIEQRVRSRVLGDISSNEGLKRRLRILAESPEIGDHIDEMYAQIRVFRAATLGFGFLSVVCAFLKVSHSYGDIKWWLMGASAWVALGSAACMTTMMRSYFRVLRMAWENVLERSAEKGVGESITSS